MSQLSAYEELTIVLKHTKTSSKVVLKNGAIYKTQPKYLADNEYYFLRHMHVSNGSLYVPQVFGYDGLETIKMSYIEPEDITDTDKFMSHLPKVLDALEKAGIRHGDLTEYAVIPHNNRPIIIDFAEARWISDPIPPKRPEPDAVLLERAMRKYAQGNK